MWAASGSETEAFDAAERIRQARTQQEPVNATEAAGTDRVQQLEEALAVSREQNELAKLGAASDQARIKKLEAEINNLEAENVTLRHELDRALLATDILLADPATVRRHRALQKQLEREAGQSDQ